MNTMELVRLVDRAQQRQTAPRTPAALFQSELFGPARHAILRARQFLLSEQQANGSWLGTQTSDASLPSRLIFLLTYLGREGSPLAQQAAAAISDQQLPSGGWPRAADGAVDLSVSVQAYLALKLTGFDPADERLSRARRVIRQMGGADAADATTRCFLALLGQVDYDCCAPIPPELLLVDARPPRCRAPMSLIWSHRPVCKVGIERGVRELFLEKPGDWPAAQSNNRREKLPRFIRLLLAFLCRYCERRGWTPLRRRALELAESRVLEQVDSAAIRQLDFRELVWHTIALHAVGYSHASPELQTCQQRLDDMVCVNDDSDRATPRLRTLPIADTLLVLRSLRASGVSADDSRMAAAVRWLSRTRSSKSPRNAIELANVVQLLCAAAEGDRGIHNALPPGIEVNRDHFDGIDRVIRTKRLYNQIRPLTVALVELILGQQKRDGGWGAPAVIGAVLEAIASFEREKSRPAMERAIQCLRITQRPDGSWANESDLAQVHATSLAVRGLLSVGVPLDDEAVAAGLNWLAVHQNPNGGWGESISRMPPQSGIQNYQSASASVSQTAWALLALVAAGQANRPAALRAVNFLLDTQEDNGSWKDPPFVLHDDAANLWFCNDLHTIAWPLLALSRWAVAAASTQPAAADEMSFRLVGAAADD